MGNWQERKQTSATTGFAALMMAVLASLSLFESGRAQQRMTARLSAVVDSQGAARAFLDSVRSAPKQWAGSGDGLMVSRRRGDKEGTYATLRQQLIDGTGVAPSAANRVYIRYRFERSGGGMEAAVVGLQYAYRPPGGIARELDLLYVEVAGNTWGQRLLEKTESLSSSKATDTTFRQALSFLQRIEAGADLQQVNGNAVTETEGAAFIEKIRRAASE